MNPTQTNLFTEKRYVGAKTTAAALRDWREKNREHVRAKDRERSRKRWHSAYMRKWRQENRDKLVATERRKRLKALYGITPADYDALVVKQGNCCAICGRHASLLKPRTSRHKHLRLDVDHCHSTGRVRALLCYNCNAILGHAQDSSERLASAIAYLKAHAL